MYHDANFLSMKAMNKDTADALCMAEDAGINFSRVLQDALKKTLA